MAKFLNTSAINYFLEELIKEANGSLILISPFLKLNDRIKELLEDKNRLKIDVRIIYGRNDLQNDEIAWLSKLTFIRTSFCKNLHAKCYLNEKSCIITSLNLYEFSQINNNEMGVAISKNEDVSLYKETYKEAQRIIRISEEVIISVEKITSKPNNNKHNLKEKKYNQLTTSKLAKKMGKTINELTQELIKKGYLEIKDKKEELTNKGKDAGAKSNKCQFGTYFLWDENLNI